MDQSMNYEEVPVSDNYKVHFRKMKLLGIVSMISIFLASVGVSLSHIKCSNLSTHHLVNNQTFINQTKCQQTYDLPDDIKIKLCKRDEGITIDLRQYINKRAMTNGITLNYRQWEYLYRIIGLIHHKVSLLSQ